MRKWSVNLYRPKLNLNILPLLKKKIKKKTSEFATKHSNLLYSLNSTLRAGKGENTV